MQEVLGDKNNVKNSAFLTIITGEMNGYSYELHEGESVNIGREIENGIGIADSYTYVSRYHCSICFDNDCKKFFVHDHSSNGIFSEEGTRLDSKTELNPGDVICLGGDECKIILSILKTQGADVAYDKNIIFDDIIEIVIEYDHKRYKLNNKKSILDYRNLWNMRGKPEEDDYYEEKTTRLTDDVLKELELLFDKFKSNCLFEKELDLLPDGASRNAYMSINYNDRWLYYTDTHADNDGGCGIKREPIQEVFLDIVQLLDGYCDFPITE
ncbi:MAG: FHA domain-containing protein [Lachnospiraceae bacterium]|nr:FHA domain-containing protein [Lachnospiraceae bacterium]